MHSKHQYTDSAASLKDLRIHHFFEQRAILSPDNIALKHHHESLTYAQVNEKATSLAGYLIETFPNESIIAINAERSIHTIIGVLAIAKANKTYLPLDSSLPVERLKKMVLNANVTACLCEGTAASIYKAMNINVVPFDAKPVNTQISFEEKKLEAAYLLYTSGSTGMPKGVLMNHLALVNLLLWQREHSIAGIGTRTLHFSPLSFDPSFLEIFSTFDTGGTLVLVDDDIRLDPEKLLHFIERESINRIYLPYVALQYITDAAQQTGVYPSAIQEMITAGEALRITNSIIRFYKMLPHARLYNQYGPTESHVVTELQLTGDPALWEPLPAIGKPIYNTDIWILDEALNPVPPGNEGELCIGGLSLADGYLNAPDVTKEKFIEWINPETGLVERIYRTGDIAYEREDGNFIFLGRRDDQVKLRGYRIELGEIEVALSKIEGIKQAVVIVGEDHYQQKRMIAYMEPVSVQVPIKIIQNSLHSILPDYMVPALFVWVHQIPKTNSGKIDKKKLPLPNNARPDIHSIYKAPLRETEKSIVKIWEEVLGIYGIGIKDNFFELGGTSLLAIKAVSNMKKVFKKDFPISNFYRHLTIEAQATYIDELVTAEPIFRKKESSNEPIAIIGMHGRFPGANSIHELWQLLKEGKETISFFSSDQLDPSIPDTNRKDPSYVKARGILADAAYFDASFFGIAPALATLMDPQHRIFLELCWELLESSAHLPEHFTGRIGVYAGCGNNTYYLNNVLPNKDKVDTAGAFNVMTYNEKDYIASRVAYTLNLKGPAVSVHAGCSTSLLAVAQAVDAIRNGYCEVALAGGVSITAPLKSGHFYQEGAMLSKDGHCKPFDADATGTVFSDGAGVVLLKSLQQAIADGDFIYGTIRGIGVNNDGYDKASFTAPSVEGQAGAIYSAMQEAGIKANDLSYIEAHGTATPLGDPIEINGLSVAYQNDKIDHKIPIGSIKSNMGHLTAAAGVVGLIKSTLILHHKQLVPSINYTKPNPEINFQALPFEIITELRRLADDKNLYAGISSFGVGGTNVHAVIASYKRPIIEEYTADDDDEVLFCLSGKTETGLKAYAKSLAQYVIKNPEKRLLDIAFSLHRSRAVFANRIALIIRTREELISQLQQFAEDIYTPSEYAGKFLAAKESWEYHGILDNAKLYANKQPHFINDLPGYAFDKKYFWIDPPRYEKDTKKDHEKSVEDTIDLQIQKIIMDVSGEDQSVVSAAVNFIEMGLDSLVLTQLAIQVSKFFGVKISFRQLNEELDSVGLLAAYIKTNSTSSASSIQVVSAKPDQTDEDAKVALQRPFGAIARIEKSAAALSISQLQFLKSFIYRYNAKTKSSKNYTAEHRTHMADPRVVTGFKPVLKEIIYPLIVNRSKGSRIWDIDNNEYIDVLNGFGSNMLGYKHPVIQEMLQKQIDEGYEIGPQHPLAGEVCKLIADITGNERVALCSTGSEAVLGVMRIARTVTGKSKIVAFNGSYHGINDEVIVRGNKNLQSYPASPGIPQEAVSNMILLEYGESESLQEIEKHADEIAAVLVEPVQSRRPEFQPKKFLEALRILTAQKNIVLIFDEVITGFRCHPAGIQGLYGIRADLVTYGKVVGGGMPIGVIAGKRYLMDTLDGGYWQFGNMSVPETGVTYFAGTFVRHPLALAAAKASLNYFIEKGIALQDSINTLTTDLVNRLNEIAEKYHTPYYIASFSSLWKIKLKEELPYAELVFALMREKGIHIWDNFPCFLTAAHTAADILAIANAFEKSIIELSKAGFFATAVAKELSIVESQITDERIAKIVPLTSPQLEIWMGCQIGEADANRAYNESVSLALSGTAHQDEIEKALAFVLNRHEALRATISEDGRHLLIHHEMPFRYVFQDISGLGVTASHEFIEAFQKEDAEEEFDLVNGPLFRAAYFKISDVSSLLMITAHHIICDGWSMGIILSEISSSYNAFVKKIEPILPTPPSFAAYALDKTKQAKKAAEQKAESYWVKKIGKNANPFFISSEKERTGIRTYRSDRLDFDLPNELIKQIALIGAKQGVSLINTLLACFEILLYKVTGSERIIIGLPAADQPVSGNDRLVGHCVNLLPIISKPNNEDLFTGYLSKRKRELLDDLDHQQVSFGKLIEQLHMSREGTEVPLTPIAFNIDIDLDDEVSFDGLAHRFISNPRHYENFEIFLNITGTDSRFALEWSYNKKLFSASFIRQMMESFSVLLSEIVKKPTATIKELGIYDYANARLQQQSFNKTHKNFPLHIPVHELFEQQVDKYKNHIAVSFNNEQVTYASLNEMVNRIAHCLIANQVKTGEIVAVCLPRSVNMVASLLGVYKAGAGFLAIDPEFPPKRIAYFLSNAGVTKVITEEAYVALFPEELQIISINEIKEFPTHNPSLFIPPNSKSFVLYTSGSTGEPKGVVLTHKGLTNVILGLQSIIGFTHKDKLLMVTTIIFDLAQADIFLPLISGGELVLTDNETSKNGIALLSKIDKHKITYLQATPVTYKIMLEAGWEHKRDIQLTCCGEPLPKDLALKLKERGTALYNMYGPTENTIYASFAKLNDLKKDITIGKPFPNTQIYVLDGDQKPLPVGIPGELFIGGEGVANGYLADQQLTDAKFLSLPDIDPDRKKFFKTGDIGYYNEEGNIIFLGRKDTQVKIRGLRIELGEIEYCLRNIPDIKDAAVIVRDDAIPGTKTLVAYVITRTPGLSKPDQQELINWRNTLEAVLPSYYIPNIFIRLEKMPLTASGKIDRLHLPQPALALQWQNDFVIPETAIEKQLAPIWAEALGLATVGITDNFFELGGHSLIAIQLMTRIRKETGRKLPISILFQYPTLQKLARLIELDNHSEKWKVLVPIKPTGTKPPLYVIHGDGLHIMVFHSFTQFVDPDQPVFGLQSIGLTSNEYPAETIEEITTVYLKEILEHNPDGPYNFAGYSFGGLVAYELTQQLMQMGKKVNMLGILDTNISNELYYDVYASRISTKLKRQIPKLAFISKSFMVNPKATFEYQKYAVTERVKSSIQKILPPKPVIQKLTNEEIILEKITKAYHNYAIKPIQARVDLFRCKKRLYFIDDPVYLGWKKFCESVHVHEIEGDHASFLFSPNDIFFAKTIQRVLNERNQ